MQAQIQVSHGDTVRAVEVHKNLHQFRKSIAGAFDLNPQGVAGLAQGKFLFPLSFLSNGSRSANTETGEPFTLLLHQTNSEEEDREELLPVVRKNSSSDAVISFQLSPANLQVSVTQKEIDLLRFVRSKTVTPTGLPPSRDELEACFALHMTGNEGKITKRSFDHLCRSLFPQTMHTPVNERKALSSSLSRIFFAFDRDGTKEALGRDLFTAFGVLLSRHGLEFAFQLADANGDGFVDKQEFFIFTRSFLTLVLALNSSVCDLSARQVSNCIDTTTRVVLDTCFQEADLNHDDLLTWQEFSGWYSQSKGHLHIPWMKIMLAPDGTGGPDGNSGGNEEEHVQIDSTVYEFHLAKGFGSLKITQNDVSLLERLLEETKLYENDLQDSIALLCSRAETNGFLSKESYDLCLRRLLGAKTVVSKESKAMLQNVFFAFDRGLHNHHVRVDELCTGFALLLRGTKSAKLQLCFSLFESDDEVESLSKQAFVRFLRSVLTMLFALNEGAALMSSNEVFEIVDTTCEQVATHIADKKERITFQDFANFYNTGSESISFVELLDLNKFPFSSSTKQALQAVPKAHHDKRVFSFDLPVGKLEIMQSDSDRVKFLVETGGFAGMSAEDLVDLCTDRAPEPKWTRHVFDSLVSNNGQHPRNVLFDKLFDAFADEHDQVVDAKQMICALSILCSNGKKSDKLALGFLLFEISSQRDLAAYLQSYLLMLFVLTNRSITWDFKRSIWQVCVDLSERVGGGLDFENFAQWYGNGGHKVASFLELLDQSKWPFAKQVKLASAVVEDEVPVFVFNLGKDHTLTVVKEDLDFVKTLVHDTGFVDLSADAVLRELQQEYMTEEDFVNMLHGLQVNNDQSVQHLLTLYQVCDRAQVGRVKSVDLFGGLVLLCGSGNKSNKLAAAWSFVASSSSKKDSLTREDMYTMFRSLLVGLYAFNLDANSRAMDETFAAVDDASTALTAKVFLMAKRKTREVITFEEFAEFYSQGGGYQLAPWLELLNLPKFIGTTSSSEASSPQRVPSSQQQQRVQDDEVIFSFALPIDDEATEEEDDGEDNSATVLVVTRRDIADFNYVLVNTRLSTMEPETMARLVAEEVDDDGLLTEQSFGTFVGKHAVVHGEAVETVATALHRVFESFDYEGNGVIEPAMLCVGLGLLTAGSKSAKLSVGWHLFSTATVSSSSSEEEEDDDEKQDDEDEGEAGMGTMDREKLQDFLRALLTSISCFAGMCLSDEVLAGVAAHAAKQVFADLNEEDNEITFQDFAEWYTNRGFETLSWIELLSAAKWRVPTAS